MQHDLKTWPEYFQAVMDRVKLFELRLNDREFNSGDTIVLKEFKPTNPLTAQAYGTPSEGEYTGRWIRCTVAYILKGDKKTEKEFGLKDGYCVMGLKIRKTSK